MQEKTEQASVSDYGATPEDKATFYFPAFRPNSRGFCRSSVYRYRTQKTSSEKVAVPVYLSGNTSSAFRMAWGLDTDTFLNAFTRFTSGRGVPKEVISDRGTNFVGAVGELKKLVSQLDRQKLESKTAELGVTWRFNPPGAPHFGGAHEVLFSYVEGMAYL